MNRHESLRPYLSVVVVERTSTNGAPLTAGTLLDSIAQLLSLHRDPRRIVDRVDSVAAGNLDIGFIHYEERKQARWTSDVQTQDVINQLVLVAAMSPHAAILVSDASRSPALIRHLDTGGEPGLRLVPEGTLNATFAKGPARTLWLSGIHTRTTVKADSKVLIGVNLRDALDPLGDQSYFFTAVRSATQLGNRRVTVGLAPRRARVWTGASHVWGEFAATLEAILDSVRAAERDHASIPNPIQVLAATAVSGQAISRAFDAWIKAPEQAEGTDIDADLVTRVETWSYDGTFKVKARKGADLSATAFLLGARVGDLDIDIDATRPERAKVTVVGAHASPGKNAAMKELVDLLRDRRWLEVRYESGHTLSDGGIYLAEYRDVIFDGWRWIRFDGFNITKEKPYAPRSHNFDEKQIGLQDSLFCWVLHHWPNVAARGRQKGWLACDDGSMEIADFIYFSDATDVPALHLIHVKASHSAAASRGISVADYEVVVSQAVKNLRNLDSDILNLGLGDGLGKRITNLVWHDGVSSTRKEMIAAIKAAGKRFDRQVVIVQPRVAKLEYDKARSDLDHNRRTSRGARLKQLETLLVGAQANCRAVSASMTVLIEDDTKKGGGRAARPRQTGRAERRRA